MLEASIYSIIKGMIAANYTSIPSTEIWQKITQTLGGKIDDDKPNIWYSDDFGKKYRNTITKLICDKFGAEIDHKDSGNNLVFDYDDFIKMGKIFENKGIIKITPVMEGE